MINFTQKFVVRAERQQLSSDFKLQKQEFSTFLILPVSFFTSIEHQINVHCKDLECFVAKAHVTVIPKLNYNSTNITQSFDVQIEHICNFDNIILIKEPIRIKL